jgi:hypothetical protein
MKSNNPDILNAIIESLERGNGRVMTCKQAGISFETFCDWTNPESPRYNSDFYERVKKAEGTGSIKIKEVCENVIMKAATDNDKPVWQAAAWMLERKYKKEYARMEFVETKEVDNFTHLTDEELDEEIKNIESTRKNKVSKTATSEKDKEL